MARGRTRAGRKAIFVGDLVDRGPRIVDTLNTVMSMSQAGAVARAFRRNHDIESERNCSRGPQTVTV